MFCQTGADIVPRCHVVYAGLVICFDGIVLFCTVCIVLVCFVCDIKQFVLHFLKGIAQFLHLVIVFYIGKMDVIVTLCDFVNQSVKLFHRLCCILHLVICDDDDDKHRQQNHQNHYTGIEITYDVDGAAGYDGYHRPVGIFHMGVEHKAFFAVEKVTAVVPFFGFNASLYLFCQFVNTAAVTRFQLVEEVVL